MVLPAAKSDATGTLSQFIRRVPIPFFTTGTSTPVNYQVKRTISWLPGMQSLFQDIRFNTKAGVYIDYWIESKVDSDTAEVWLELPDAITDPGSDTVWMYYGNAGLADGGAGDDTFEFFDDFSGTLTTKWTVTGSPIIEAGRLKIVGNGDVWDKNGVVGKVAISRPAIMEWEEQHSVTNAESQSGYAPLITVNTGVSFYYFGGGATIRGRVINDGSDVTLINQNTNSLKMRIDIKTTQGYAFWINEIKYEHTSIDSSSNWYPVMQDARATQFIDNVRFRKYIANEPTSSVGTAQHQRRTAQFM